MHGASGVNELPVLSTPTALQLNIWALTTPEFYLGSFSLNASLILTAHLCGRALWLALHRSLAL